MRFNPPPGWPSPPSGWVPPAGWQPDPSWPPPPVGWQVWLPDPDDAEGGATDSVAAVGASATATEPSRADPPREVQGEDGPTPLDASPDTVLPADPAPREAPVTGDVAALLARIRELELALERAAAAGPMVELDDQRMLQDVGIYRYHHPLESAGAYKERLRELETQMDSLLRAGQGVLAADMFTFAGSLAKGRRMVADLSKLMLRAYNAEADNCVRSLRSGNVETAKRRLEASVTAIEKLGAIMQLRVNPDYHALRLLELELVADYQMKVQAEREEAREQRELLREQRRAEAELAAERERLDKERAHYASVLATLRANNDPTAADLESRLTAIDEAIAANDFRTANIRAGYVYVISNVGAFGPRVVKIGMTRRLEPLDRVRELGDASVPFQYDVHALFFSEDAVALENELHRAFADRRVNRVNERREFFFATPAEVREVLDRKTGGLLEFTESPEADEYLRSRGLWPAELRDA